MLLWCLAAMCAYYVKGLCGFANTLVFTSILAFTNSHAGISPIELVLGFPSNAIIAWRERCAIDLRICLPLIALVLLGSVPGIWLLRSADVGAIKILFGVVILVVGADMILCKRRENSAQGSGVRLLVIGIVSGVLCGLFGVGALMSAYVGRTAKDHHAFRANMCAVFAAENIFRIVAYAAIGLITTETLMKALLLFPPMLIGLVLGMRSAGKLDEVRAKRVVIVALMVSGAALILNNL